MERGGGDEGEVQVEGRRDEEDKGWERRDWEKGGEADGGKLLAVYGKRK